MSRLPLDRAIRLRQAVVAAHINGETNVSIARNLGIGLRTVQRYIECANIPKASERTRADILAAYCAGEKAAHIAARFDVTTRTVHRYAAEAKVQRRAGRPCVWPDCPAHVRPEYLRLAREVGAHEARKALEQHA